MIAGDANPARWPRVRWFHFVLLIGLLAAGGVMRWHQIDRHSLWLDEYWTLYLATGRASQLFKLPLGIILNSPPNVGFSGALAWWHIWNGISSTTHPPLYFFALRTCVHFFGDSDRAIRSMSAGFSLAGVVVLFSLVRRIRGPWAGLIAAGIMIFAPIQIDYSQTARPYTMLAFFALLFCHTLLSMQWRGPTRRRMLLLSGSAAAMALTHYFSAGAMGGAILYSAIFLKGDVRKSALISISAGLILAILLWGPVFWNTRAALDAFPNFSMVSKDRLAWIVRGIVTAPAQLFLDAAASWDWRESILLALLVYLAPPLLAQKSPEMLLWWFWILGAVGLLLSIDIVRGTAVVTVIRYLFIVSPILYIILTTLLPDSWLGKLVSCCALACALVYGIDRFQVGRPPTPDWKGLSRLTDQVAGPEDIVAFAGNFDFEPQCGYFVMSHYLHSWTRPVIFLMDRPGDSVLRELAARPRIWIVGHDPKSETARLFPGWSAGSEHSIGPGDCLWAVAPTTAGNK